MKFCLAVIGALWLLMVPDNAPQISVVIPESAAQPLSVINQEVPEGVPADEEKICVPGVQNKTVEEAAEILEAAGFSVMVGYEHSDTVATGVVITQSVAEGSYAAPGSMVEITISKDDDPSIVRVKLGNQGITDLSEVEIPSDVTHLELNGNSISDISALAGLTNLRSLYLHDTQVSDINALVGLTNLTELALNNTQISDISVLSGLTNLTLLSLNNTPIRDISALSGLTNLTLLSLRNTPISDISALSGLTNLTDLYMDDTPISDISALSGLTTLTRLSLGNTQI
ncbi:MAG: leucine-rich repeat domain-containing protein, partial [Clostridiales bacterium]|nr:leucine-rich repeat domain-containing protein [Clostridiales bacterium]